MPTSFRRQTRRAFTLVELVTAASLMTVMMLGVVEIFGIVATTAGDAEGIHFAQQQLRAFFDRLHRDVRGMTREGYLSIHKGMVYGGRGSRGRAYDYQADSAAPPNRTYPERYGADTLTFVTIGTVRNQMDGTPREANAAEVVYTNQVLTDGEEVLRVDGLGVDPRRGVLGRGLWLLAGTTTSSGAWAGHSEHGYLCDLFSEENEKLLNQQPGRGGTTTPPDPEILDVGGAAAQGALRVVPWIAGQSSGGSSNLDSLNRVMACCVSEFYVEAMTPISMGATYWHGGDDAGRTYRWADTYESAGEPLTYDQTNEPIESWPPAIRVTVALHDPGDGGDIPDGQDRFQGYAMQEIFWIGDP